MPTARQCARSMPDRHQRTATSTGLSRALIFVMAFLALAASPAQNRPGVFEDATNVGATAPGSVQFDAGKNEYRVTGGGPNMWDKADGFHFLWRKMTGDFQITADVRFVAEGKNPHRKAVLLVRQDLGPGSAYVDAAVHGDGLTSLQFRPAHGDTTSEVKAPNEWFGSAEPVPASKAPRRIRIVRRGDRFVMYGGTVQGEMRASEAVTVRMKDPVYVGLGVCSHEADMLETAAFSNVSIK